MTVAVARRDTEHTFEIIEISNLKKRCTLLVFCSFFVFVDFNNFIFIVFNFFFNFSFLVFIFYSYLSSSITPSAFFRSSFVTLFVLFKVFDSKDRFEKKFCNNKQQNIATTIQVYALKKFEFMHVYEKC